MHADPFRLGEDADVDVQVVSPYVQDVDVDVQVVSPCIQDVDVDVEVVSPCIQDVDVDVEVASPCIQDVDVDVQLVSPCIQDVDVDVEVASLRIHIGHLDGDVGFPCVDHGDVDGDVGSVRVRVARVRVTVAHLEIGVREVWAVDDLARGEPRPRAHLTAGRDGCVLTRMQRQVLAFTALALTACNGSPSTDAGPDIVNQDVATPTDATGDVSADTPATCTLSDAGTTDAGYIPAGYVLTPFLSDTASTHTFAQADMVIEACKHYEAVLETDVGRIVFDFFDAQTPISTNSFVFLARNHYFDGIAFHRVIDGFVAQGGDPNTLGTNRATWGSGGPGYSFGLEIDPSLNFDRAGMVGMARTSDPNSNGSQFYITLAATPSLDSMYTVFAQVTEGASVLAMIARSNGMNPPTTPTRMQRVYIVERAR